MGVGAAMAMYAAASVTYGAVVAGIVTVAAYAMCYAVVGGLTAAVMGGDIKQGMLYGAIGGAVIAGGGIVGQIANAGKVAADTANAANTGAQVGTESVDKVAVAEQTTSSTTSTPVITADKSKVLMEGASNTKDGSLLGDLGIGENEMSAAKLGVDMYKGYAQGAAAEDAAKQQQAQWEETFKEQQRVNSMQNAIAERNASISEAQVASTAEYNKGMLALREREVDFEREKWDYTNEKEDRLRSIRQGALSNIAFQDDTPQNTVAGPSIHQTLAKEEGAIYG